MERRHNHLTQSVSAEGRGGLQTVVDYARQSSHVPSSGRAEGILPLITPSAGELPDVPVSQPSALSRWLAPQAVRCKLAWLVSKWLLYIFSVWFQDIMDGRALTTGYLLDLFGCHR
jgi:hypothetical protein